MIVVYQRRLAKQIPVILETDTSRFIPNPITYFRGLTIPPLPMFFSCPANTVLHQRLTRLVVHRH
jgi:hypothetical protein